MILQSDLILLHRAKRFARDVYAWPGGYPMAAITADGACLCADCVKKEWRLICEETFQNTNCGFRIAGVEVNWENTDLYCDSCDKKMESAYGDE